MSSTTSIRLSKIGQIMVNVRDLDHAVEFYRDVLGMEFLFTAPNMAFFQCGDVRLMLGVADKPEFDHPASIIYYRVDDIHAAYETLMSRGVTFEHKPNIAHRAEDHDLWLAFFRDVDNNVLALMSEQKTAS